MAVTKTHKKPIVSVIITALVLALSVSAFFVIKNAETGANEIENIYEENAETLENAIDKDVIPQNITTTVGKNGVIVPDVPFISQANYPSGCESVSTVMALNYAGINISVDDFIDYYLSRADFVYENGKTYGYHPNNYFMGNPYTSNGFGCYAPCIEKAIVNLLPEGFVLSNTTGKSISYLCETYINKGIPVIFWATVYMVGTSDGPTWNLVENNKTYTWVNNEHCLLLTGYDDEYYYFNDPMAGQVRYDRETVEKRYKALGMQSLAVYNKSGTSTDKIYETDNNSDYETPYDDAETEYQDDYYETETVSEPEQTEETEEN